METRLSYNRFLFLFLAVLSAVLLYLAWPTRPFFPLIFLAFTPLLWINEQLGTSRLKLGAFAGYTYIALSLFNIFTTWWIWNSTPPGAVFAMLVNALLMLIPWLLYRITTYRLKLVWWSHFSIVPYFITFEYWHLNWDLSWPWLTLGNSTALYPEIVQWYEWIGVLGGTFWILIVNVLIYLCYTSFKKNRQAFKKTVYISLVVLLFPILASSLRYLTYQEKGIKKEVLVVQPNIDPYTQKYPGTTQFIPYDKQYDRLSSMTEDAVERSTDFVLWPETSFPEDLEEKQAMEYQMVKQLIALSDRHPQSTFLIGADTYRLFKSNENEGNQAYPTREENVFYTPYNTGIFLQKGTAPLFYHKSKLVPGVEILPYPHVFGLLTQGLGEIVMSVGRQKERAVFKSLDGTISAPVVCYESIYGEFLGEYVSKGAGLFFIITNDAWWGNTDGHQQHFHYSRLRAVEHRKCVARSANTGISGFINQRGDVMSQSKYNEQRTMKEVVLYNPKPTLYSRCGDYIGKIAIIVSFLFVSTFLFSKKING